MLKDSLSLASIHKRFMKSLTGKIFILGFIILLLLIPYFMAVGLRHERNNRAFKAEAEVSAKWGEAQLVTAPVLSIPVHRSVLQNDSKTKDVRENLYVLPENLKIEGEIIPEIRYRGIYPVMLYRSEIRLKAKFTDLPENYLTDNWQVVENGGAEMLFSVADVKGIQKFTAQINGMPSKPMAGKILTFPVKIDKTKAELEFTADLELNGCRNLLFSPIGQNFELSLTSPWPHPSFTGGFLPKERKISEKGFEAKWSVHELNSAFASRWVGRFDQLPLHADDHSRTLGVSLVQPAGPYQQVERVSNYAFLLIAIVLIAFLIGENVTKIWIHPIQYFFAGLTLVMFYVLLLALAEHMNFNLSYLITTLVIAGMTTLYCRMIFARKPAAALLLGGVMFLAYLLIFALTRLEDYALLAGSIILLFLLGILMRVTGNINKEGKTAAVEDLNP